jgi:WXG100 family type VII secretion target
MASVVMVNYDNVKKLAASLNEKSNRVKGMRNQIVEQVGILNGNAWISDAATAWYRQVNATVEATERLAKALDTASDVVGGRITNLFKKAEQDGQAAIPNPQD